MQTQDVDHGEAAEQMLAGEPMTIEHEPVVKPSSKVPEASGKAKYIDIFMRAMLSEAEKSALQTSDDKEAYEMPLISLAHYNTTSVYLLRLLGRNKEDAAPEIRQTEQLIRSKTAYAEEPLIPLSELKDSIASLISELAA